MELPAEIIGQIECHEAENLRKAFAGGLDPNILFRGKPLIDELTSEYARGPLFKQCVKVFVDYGLRYPDAILLDVLLDDAAALRNKLQHDAAAVHRRHSLRCAYTPLLDATLLHVCAEFNHVESAKVLVEFGADVDAPAGKDEWGFGAQTPVFHTVNQNQHRSKEMMDFLLEQSADLRVTVAGLIWGKGYDWETLIPSVDAISYAMMGLLPQMHRDEPTIHSVVSLLLEHRYNITYQPKNVPNKYLHS